MVPGAVVGNHCIRHFLIRWNFPLPRVFNCVLKIKIDKGIPKRRFAHLLFFSSLTGLVSLQISIPIDSPEENGTSIGNNHETSNNLHHQHNSQEHNSPSPDQCNNLRPEPEQQDEDVTSNLEVFQQQRLLHTNRLKKEIVKLERQEHDMAASAFKVEKVAK